MLVIAGFESQIAARAALASIARAASESGATLGGAALARLGFEDAIHVDRVSGLNLPGHVLRALDDVVAGEPGHPTLSLERRRSWWRSTGCRSPIGSPPRSIGHSVPTTRRVC